MGKYRSLKSVHSHTHLFILTCTNCHFHYLFMRITKIFVLQLHTHTLPHILSAVLEMFNVSANTLTSTMKVLKNNKYEILTRSMTTNSEGHLGQLPNVGTLGKNRPHWSNWDITVFKGKTIFFMT